LRLVLEPTLVLEPAQVMQLATNPPLVLAGAQARWKAGQLCAFVASLHPALKTVYQVGDRANAG
jgi:hypothetical protein